MFNNNRWAIRQEYFGKFEFNNIICETQDISTAKFIMHLFEKYYNDRPFKYSLVKIADDYNRIFDEDILDNELGD